MPVAEATLYFYDIQAAGYYERGSDTRVVGGVDQTLTGVRDWVRRHNKKLSETATYHPSASSRLMQCYCAGVEHDSDTGDYLVTMWNRTESFDGEVASIEDLPAGQRQVHLTELPENTIPGYATYFWVFPRLNRYAAVQLQSVRNGRAEFDYYLKSYLSKFSPEVRYADADAAERVPPDVDLAIAGYGSSARDGRPLVPKWSSERVLEPGPIERIRANRSRIRKMVRKNELKTDIPMDRTLFHRLLAFFSSGEAPQQDPGAEVIRIRLEMDLTPGEEELAAIITDWEENQEEGSGWNDAGFVFEREQQIHWLSHASPKVSLSLEFAETSPILIDGRSLLAALSAKRGSALQDLR